MKLNELSQAQLEKLRSYRYDQIVEKHEGPWRWSDTLRFRDPEFLSIEGFDVLLPLDRAHHPNITILRCILSKDERVLTIFPEDTTYFTGVHAGFLAVCERVPDEEWFVATVYHEWF